MASGFGTFDGNAVVISGATSMFIQTAVSQSVNQSARTVTVTVSSYVGYYRNSGGNWNTGSYTYFWRTNHTDAYFTNNIDGSANTISTKLAVGIPYSMTVTTGTKATVLNGLGSQYSDYGYVVTSSKTYNYDNNGSAITGNWSATLHEYDSSTGWHDATASGSFTTDSIGSAASAPSGATVKYNSSTYNSINITSTVSSWGSGYTDTPHLQQIVCLPDSTASNWYQRGRRVHDNRTTAKTSTGTVTNSDQAYNGGLTIKGASNYKVACWASTTVGEAHAISSALCYTPPAPLGTFTKLTETRGATAVATRFQIIGGSSSQNSSNNVTTQYRLSTNGGSTFSNWTDVGSAASAYTTKNLDLNIPYSASVQIQARQVYQGLASQTSTIAYTALGPVAPSNPAITVNSKTWNSVNLTGSIDDYGYPSAASGRKINIGLAETASTSAASLEVQNPNVASATVTVNQNSLAVRGGFTIKGMMTVYPYTWADNSLATNYIFGVGEVLPPAPGQITYSVDPDDASEYTVSFTGDATKNITTYTPVELTRTVRYADSNDPTNWTYIANDANAPVDWVTTQTITVSAGHTIIVEAWMTYMGIQSGVTTLSITNSSDPVRLYGAARREDPDNPGTLLDPTAEEIEHLYGSVNGTAKKLIKFYGSENGVAKLIFEDL